MEQVLSGDRMRSEYAVARAVIEGLLSVRATMLARMLECPPGLDDDTLVAEMTDLVVRYLAADADVPYRAVVGESKRHA
jgi:hypothetical protein